MATRTTRKPAVAGQFYPRSPDELRKTVARLMGPTGTDPAMAVMAPHAGYRFSGATAGRIFGRVDVPTRVIVLSPNHTGCGQGLAIWDDGAWETPLGDVPIDHEFTRSLLGGDTALCADPDAHIGEHGIEVELPFLFTRNPQLELTAIVIGRESLEQIIALGELIADTIERLGAPALLVASTDMSHFVSAHRAAILDRLALAQVEKMSPVGLYNTVRENRISMCGVLPTVAALAAANRLGATTAQVVEYTHSGAVTGDHDRVVGYASALVQ